MTGKFRDSADGSCNINLQLTKKVLSIFHNFRGYDSHLIFREFNKFDVKDEKIGDDGKISDGHLSVRDYLTCGKIWDKLEMKNMGGYHNHYLKKGV